MTWSPADLTWSHTSQIHQTAEKSKLPFRKIKNHIFRFESFESEKFGLRGRNGKAKSCPISNLKSIVGPASKLHLTILVIKREPSDVNWTGGFENTSIIRFYCLEVFRIKKCYREGCRCTGQHWSPPRWSGKSSRKIRWHWNNKWETGKHISCQASTVLQYLANTVLQDCRTFSYCRTWNM